MTAVAERRLLNARVGMALMLMAEAMFFAGLISAYLVARAHATTGWPPVGQPRLPIASTGFNTVILLLSLVTLYVAQRTPREAGRWILATAGLGALFLFLQGSEWVALVGYGLTTRSSLYGAFFYAIIGAHGLHVLVGLLALLALGVQVARGRASETLAIGSGFYWAFVVGLWPLLYVAVYIL